MTLRSSIVLVASLLSLTSCILSHPFSEEGKPLDVSIDAIEILAETVHYSNTNNSISNTTQSIDKLRQDGDGDGGDAPDTPDITNVGQNVGQIVSGVLGGNFDSIFAGTAGFITEQDTKTGVQTIFSSLARPLTQLFQTGFQTGANYLGFGNATTPRTPGAAGAQGTATGTAAGQQPLPAAPVAAASAPVAAAAAEAPDAPPQPPPREPVKSTSDADEDEDESEAEVYAAV